MRSSPRSLKIATGTLVVLAILTLGGLTAGTAWWGRYLAQPGPLSQPAAVQIQAGQGPRAIANELYRANVIQHPTVFVWGVRFMGLDSTLKAGEYHFEPGISLRAVINKLAIGDTESRSVTIPEGFTVKQIMQRLAETEGLTGNATRPLEGTVFPSTYAFRFGTERDKIIESMVSRMEQEARQAWRFRAGDLPLKSQAELVILASIIQKEAANEAEMPRIAAVFVNRLRKGMKLQSDPTVIYGAGEYDGNIRKKDLADPQPFNTYIHPGLPPTPIANPGRAALMAAARPAVTEELFFVADPSRTTHIFSTTYAEHQQHVKRYWREVSRTTQTEN